jgi:MtN3 and saliva related transmembrane protein
MKNPFYIGLMAAALTTAAFLPQVIKSWRTKKTKDVSLLMLIVFATGVLLWLIYGVILNDLPIMLANSVTFVLVMVLLFLKLKHR